MSTDETAPAATCRDLLDRAEEVLTDDGSGGSDTSLGLDRIDAALALIAEALALRPDDEDWPAAHVMAAGTFGRRYGETGSDADLDRAVDHLEAALAALDADQPERLPVLGMLTDVLATRGGGQVRPADLGSWIARHEELHDRYLGQLGDGERVVVRSRLAVGLVQRSPAAGPSPDRDRAIDLLEGVLAEPGPEDEYRFELRCLLAQQLLLGTLPPGARPGMGAAELLATFGTNRFPATASAGRAVDQLVLALEAPAAASPAVRGRLLALLAQAHLMGAAAQRTPAGPGHVVDLLAEARHALRAGSPGRAELVLQLGRMRSQQARQPDGTRADLDVAIADLTEASRLLAAGHPLRPQADAELGLCLARRFVFRRDAADRRRAVQLLENAARAPEAVVGQRADFLGTLGQLLVAEAATAGAPDAADRAVDALRAALAGEPPARPAAQYLVDLGNALTFRFGTTGRDADAAEAIRSFERATELVPDERDPIHVVALLSAGSTLADRFDARRDAQDIEHAVRLLTRVDEVLERLPELLALPGVPGRAYARSLLAGARFQQVQQDELAGRPQAALEPAVLGLEAALRELPPDDPLAPRLRSELHVGRQLLALRRGDMPGMFGDADGLAADAELMPVDHPDRAPLLGRAGIVMATTAAIVGDRRRLDRGVALLERAHDEARAGHTPRLRTGLALGEALLTRYRVAGRDADLAAAVDRLAQAYAACEHVPGHPLTPVVARELTAAFRARSDPARDDAGSATRVGLAGVRAHARNVLLQTGAATGLTAARAAAEDAVLTCLRSVDAGDAETAFAALETGRALVLHAAIRTGDLERLLTDNGEAELAEEWRAAGTRQTTAAGLADGPSDEAHDDPAFALSGGTASMADLDLRHRVLAALQGTAEYRRLLDPPEIRDVARTLAAAGRDALVYLVPETVAELGPGRGGREVYPGRALVLWFDGVLVQVDLPGLRTGAEPARYEAARAALANGGEPAAHAFSAALTAIGDWAADVALTPLTAHLRERIAGRDPRLVLVPVGLLGAVPWHVARLTATVPEAAGGPASRYLVHDVTVSYASSARQFAEAAGRTRLPFDAGVVFVADPDGTLPYANLGARSVRSTFYPKATYLGRPRRDAAGRGTVAETLRYLPGPDGAGPAILSFDCHAQSSDRPERSGLRLADGDLSVERVLARAAVRPAGAGGGLVLLSACVSDLAVADHDEALTLATAFLAAGAVSVIGTRWAIDDGGTAVLGYAFHHFFEHGRRSPGAALRAAQQWALDPNRAALDGMPDHLSALTDVLDLTDPRFWAAFSHHGW